jgi:hypothetical protein
MNAPYNGSAPIQEILAVIDLSEDTGLVPSQRLQRIVPAPYVPSEALLARLANDFSYHPPTEAAGALGNATSQGQRYNAIRGLAGRYARWLSFVVPGGRELSLALTALDEAVFWANAAIARNEAPADA